MAALLGVVVVLGWCGPVSGQEAGGPAPEGVGLAAPLLDGSHAMAAHRLAEGWVRAGRVDRGELTPVMVTDVSAVRVTLRIGGFVVGVGDARRQDLSAVVGGPGPAENLSILVADATERALVGLAENQRDAAARAAADGRGGGAVDLATAGARAQVDVQLAKRLETIRVPVGARVDVLLGSFAPGYHGLRLPGAGAGVVGAWVWPGTALALNMNPLGQLNQLLADGGLNHEVMESLGEPGGPGVERFAVLQVVRPASDRSAVELVRGNVVLPKLAVNSRTLREMGERMAGHLSRRFTAEGVRGTYQPSRDEYGPWANDEEAALAGYALLRHSKMRAPLRPGDETAAGLAKLAVGMATRVLSPKGGAEVTANPAATALALLTLLGAEDVMVDRLELRGAAAGWLMSLRGEGGRYYELVATQAGKDEAPKRKPVSATTQAIVTAALSAYYERTREVAVGEAVKASLEALWEGSGGNPNVAVLPWFLAAQTKGGRLLAGEDRSAKARIAERERKVGELVDRLCEQQVIEPPLLGPADVVGGFELARGPAGSPPNPNWRTAQLLYFLAVALAEPGVAEGHNAFDWALTGGLAARFLGQLMMDEPSCYYVRSPREAMGGVRQSLWDNQLTATATAFSLLAVTQLQESLKAVEAGVGP